MQVNLKKEAVKIGLGLLYVLAVIFVIRYFHLNPYQIYIFLLLNSLVLSLCFKRFKLKTFLKTAVVLAIIMILIRYLSGYGFIISVAAICGIILYTRRKRFIEIKQHIEAMIWGKALKDFVAAGQRPPKIKLKK